MNIKETFKDRSTLSPSTQDDAEVLSAIGMGSISVPSILSPNKL